LRGERSMTVLCGKRWSVSGLSPGTCFNLSQEPDTGDAGP
jgi:hypothetical protein